jgi:hypothetical protein
MGIDPRDSIFSKGNFPKWCTAPLGHTIFTRQILPSSRAAFGDGHRFLFALEIMRNEVGQTANFQVLPVWPFTTTRRPHPVMATARSLRRFASQQREITNRCRLIF